MKKCAKWTKEEDDFLIKNYQRLSYREIAKYLNGDRNTRGVSKRARRLNLKKMTFISTHIEKGQRFNKLVAEKEGKSVKSRKEVRRYWIFKCDCGKTKEINIRSVITEKIKSCGCICRPPDRFLSQKPPGFISWTNLFCTSRMSAEEREIPFNLNKDQFVLIASLRCHYCGCSPRKWNVYIKKDGTTRNRQYCNIKEDTIERAWVLTNGIDRQNNELGYTIENCVPCCGDCNEMKMDRTVEEFLTHIKKITVFQENKK
jgi:hypothetical protein